jgi:hypothetical protein
VDDRFARARYAAGAVHEGKLGEPLGAFLKEPLHPHRRVEVMLRNVDDNTVEIFQRRFAPGDV